MSRNISFPVLPMILIRIATMLFALVLGCLPALATAIVTEFHHSRDGEQDVVELSLTGAPESRIVLLMNPDRVALDLTDTVTAVRPELVEADDALLIGLRDGLASQDDYRIVFELGAAALPSLQSEETEEGTRLILRFEPASPAAFARAARRRSGEGRVAEAGAPDRAYTVVLDAGHGGRDYGAIGQGGTREKDLNLAFALTLREALEDAALPVSVVMTRDDDTLVPLAERSAMARRAGADLFVSIHADSIRYEDLRGATVYTLSGQASDSLSREIADGENAADRFVGEEWTQDTPEIHDILVDLVQRETETLSQRFADTLVAKMRAADIRLINNPRRSAGFRVLMAPDVPSVLLEMGYLSNPDDETLMGTPEWQAKTAQVVAQAIAGFLQGQPVAAEPE